MSRLKHSFDSSALIITMVAGTLLAPGKAQAFPLFDLAEIWAPVGIPTNFVESFVPGTSIPITVTTTQLISRTAGGRLLWANNPPNSHLVEANNWTIIIGAPSEDVEITLVDFDRFSAAPGGISPNIDRVEMLSQLDATLGAPAPTNVVTTGAPGNAQMIYQAGVNGGRIIHSTIFGPGNVDAGDTVALWEDVNLSTITFTTNRNFTGLAQAIDVRLGEVQVIPEPSTWLLLGMGLTGLAYWRKKRAY